MTAGTFPPTAPVAAPAHVYGNVKTGVNFRLKPETKTVLESLKASTQAAPMAIDRTLATSKELIKHELVFVDENSASGNMVNVILSPAGLAKNESYAKTANVGTGTPRGPLPKPEDFEIEPVTIPEIRRGAAARAVYPFEKLAVGQGFFIASSEGTPNPAKSKQGTVTAANKKALAAFEAAKAAGGVPEGAVPIKFRIWPDERKGVKGAMIGRES